MSKFSKGFSRALKVAELVENSLPKTISLGDLYPDTGYDKNEPVSNWYFIEGYQNGRENGVIILEFKNNTAFYVCQERRTDNLGFYKGSYALQGLSQKAYENPNFGNWSEEEVAERICNEIKKILTC